jgi:glycosyltransferase involved in cell wall biosynthesis
MTDKLLVYPDRPSVSVVIPTFNRGPLMKRAIDSASNQTYAPAEIIVVDDCSTDDTAEVIASYSGPLTPIYKRLDRNGGGAVARNAGIRAATSEYIAFLDSDDEWRPDHLSGLLSASAHQSGHFAIASSALRVGKTPRVRPGLEYPLGESVAEKLHFVISAELAFQTSTLLMPRTTALQFMFDPHLRRYQDWDLAFRLIESNVALVLLPHATTIYHPPNVDGITRTRTELPSLRFLAKHRGMMSRKTLARFVALQIMRRRGIGIRIIRYLSCAMIMGGISLKEFAYYAVESRRPGEFSGKR